MKNQDKINFISDFKQTALNETLLENMSEINFEILLIIIFKLCTSVKIKKKNYLIKFKFFFKLFKFKFYKK